MSNLFNMADIPAEFQETATVATVEYACTPLNPLATMIDVTELGLDTRVEHALLFDVDVLAKCAVGSLITFRSTEYRVGHVSEDSSADSWTAFLVSKYGGA